MKQQIKIIFILLILIFSTSLFCQEKNIPFDDLMKSVVYLQDKHPKIQVISGKSYELGIRKIGEKRFKLLEYSISGTGFFIKSKGKLFLVTAEHIARELINNPSLVTSDMNGDAKEYSLKGEINWKFHKNADIAVSIIRNSILFKLFYDNAIDKNFLNDSLDYPDAEFPIAVIGFPLNLGIHGKFSPLRRDTNAASKLIDLPRADNKKISTFFILQDPSIGGYSGAPVFIIEAYRFGHILMKGFDARLCVGIIHGILSDNTGGKLGMVVPAKFIKDLIE